MKPLVPAVLAIATIACAPLDPGEEDRRRGEPALRCAEPDEVPCEDAAYQTLELKSAIAAGDIATTVDGDQFVTHVDATAGGFPATDSYVYARFTTEGLEKVDISDEESLESMEWDIAFRRFIIRVNSGVSGPSCVSVARTAAATRFDEVRAVPAGLSFHVEEFFTDSCDLIVDGSGLGSPGVVLQNFWTYPGCVAMTGNVYVVEPRDGAAIKLEVLSYYAPEVQETCDVQGEVPAGPTGAGNITMRWAFIGP
jgi:hypothetical protein